MDQGNKHTFALYCKSLPEPSGRTLTITDKELFHRATTILRLKANETVILFDGRYHSTCKLLEETYKHKNTISAHVIHYEKSAPIKPRIQLYQGITKKTAFEEIVYNAAALGVSTIIPLTTKKADVGWWNNKSLERLQNIAITACEQAKNFTLPNLHSPQPFQTIFEPQPNALNIVFDPTGKSLPQTIGEVHQSDLPINVAVGPEGGFTSEELNILRMRSFIPCKLTPTILRSVEAVTVGIGVIRCFFNELCE